MSGFVPFQGLIRRVTLDHLGSRLSVRLYQSYCQVPLYYQCTSYCHLPDILNTRYSWGLGISQQYHFLFIWVLLKMIKLLVSFLFVPLRYLGWHYFDTSYILHVNMIYAHFQEHFYLFLAKRTELHCTI